MTAVASAGIPTGPGIPDWVPPESVEERLSALEGFAGLGADPTGVVPADGVLVTALSLGIPIDFGGKANTFKFTAANFDLPDGAYLFGRGALLDFSQAPYNAKLFSAVGVAGPEIALTANTTAGASSVTVASHSFVAGDLVKIGATNLYDPGRTDTAVGEYGRVVKTTATVVTLRSPLAGGTYTTANGATVQKVTPKQNIRLEGFRIKGAGLESVATTTLSNSINASDMSVIVASVSNIASQHTIKIDSEYININGKAGTTLSVYTDGEGRGAYDTTAASHTAGATVTIASTHYGLWLDMCENVQVTDVSFQDCFLMGMQVGDSLNVHVNRCNFDNSRRWNSGYGLQFTSASQDCTVSRCTFSRIRHAMTTGGATATGRKGITRRIGFYDFNVYDSYANTGDAVDTHSASEDIWFDRGFIYDAAGIGINFECPSGSIANVDIIRPLLHGVYFHNEALPDTHIRISNVNVTDGGGIGIAVLDGQVAGAGLGVRAISVRGCDIDGVNDRGIYIGSGDPAILFTGVTVADNNVNRCGLAPIVGGGADAIKLLRCTDFTVTGNVGRNLVGSSWFIHLQTCTGGAVGGGNRGGSANVGCEVENDCSNITIAGNDFEGCTFPVVGGTGAKVKVGLNGGTNSTVSVASASTITFPPHLTRVDVTGTTDVTSITASWAGREVQVRLTGTARLMDGGNLKLAGNIPAAGTADTFVRLLSDGTNWWQTSPAVSV